MSKTLFIVGNGLGRAISNENYDLVRVATEIYQNSDLFNKDDKKIIEKLIQYSGNGEIKEENLFYLHQVVTSINNILEIGVNVDDILIDSAKKLPKKLTEFTNQIAYKFHSNYNELSCNQSTFFANFSDYIKNNKSSVATLNYDRLLFYAFYKNGILKGANGYLLDGFVKREVSTGNFKYLFTKPVLDNIKKDQGYYFHLHGSIAYISEKGVTEKLLDYEIGQSLIDDRKSKYRNLILTHPEKKLDVILSSNLLHVYWQYFEREIIDSELICIIGYGAGDSHLNDYLKRGFCDKKTLLVVDRSASMKLLSEDEYIEKIFGNDFEYTSSVKFSHLEESSIFNFDFNSLNTPP